MIVCFAFECTHAAPHSFRSKFFAPQNMPYMSFTLDTPHFETSPLNACRPLGQLQSTAMMFGFTTALLTFILGFQHSRVCLPKFREKFNGAWSLTGAQALYYNHADDLSGRCSYLRCFGTGRYDRWGEIL